MTPEQALALIENLKREAPEKLVAASNTIALEAARWAAQAIVRDKKIYAEVQEIKKLLMQLGGVTPADVPVEQAAPSMNGAHAAVPDVDPSTLKGEELEAYMDAILKGTPPNPNAPTPQATASTEDAPVERPEGVVVVPAAAAKAKARAAQANNTAAPKA